MVEVLERCQLALEDADTGDLSYQDIARIVLETAGYANLVEALRQIEALCHMETRQKLLSICDAALKTVGSMG